MASSFVPRSLTGHKWMYYILISLGILTITSQSDNQYFHSYDQLTDYLIN